MGTIATTPKRAPKFGGPDRPFTTGDVAAICQVAPRTVSKWFDGGRLRGYRVPGGCDRRVQPADLVTFMIEHGWPDARIRWVEQQAGLVRRALTAGLSGGQRIECEEHAAGGVRVEHADGLIEAGVMLVERRPTVVVVDLRVGRDEASRLAGLVAARPDLAGVRAVAVTDDPTATDADAAELVAAGFDAVYQAPVDWSAVLAAKGGPGR